MPCNNILSCNCTLRFVIERIMNISLLMSIVEIVTPFLVSPCTVPPSSFYFTGWISVKGWITLIYALGCYTLYQRRIINLDRLSDLFMYYGGVILLWWLSGVFSISAALSNCDLPTKKLVAWEILSTPLVIVVSCFHWMILDDSSGDPHYPNCIDDV